MHSRVVADCRTGHPDLRNRGIRTPSAPWFNDADPATGRGLQAAVARDLASTLGYSADRVRWVAGSNARADVTFPDPKLTGSAGSANSTATPATDKTVGYFAVNDALVVRGTARTSAPAAANIRLGFVTGTQSEWSARSYGAASALGFSTESQGLAALAAGRIDAMLVPLTSRDFASAFVACDRSGGANGHLSNHAIDHESSAGFTAGDVREQRPRPTPRRGDARRRSATMDCPADPGRCAMNRQRTRALAAMLAVTALGVAACEPPQSAVDGSADSASRQGVVSYLAVVDRASGNVVAQTRNSHTQVASESIMKLFIAAYYPKSYGGYDKTPQSIRNRLAFMIQYSDNATASALFTASAIPSVAAGYGLAETTNAWGNPGYWGAARITAFDMAKFMQRASTDPQVGPWLLPIMAGTARTGSGEDANWNQYYGLNALSGEHGSKLGWGCDSYWTTLKCAIHSVGYTDRYFVAVPQLGPNLPGTMPATATATAQRVQGSVRPIADGDFVADPRDGAVYRIAGGAPSTCRPGRRSPARNSCGRCARATSMPCRSTPRWDVHPRHLYRRGVPHCRWSAALCQLVGSIRRPTALHGCRWCGDPPCRRFEGLQPPRCPSSRGHLPARRQGLGRLPSGRRRTAVRDLVGPLRRTTLHRPSRRRRARAGRSRLALPHVELPARPDTWLQAQPGGATYRIDGAGRALPETPPPGTTTATVNQETINRVGTGPRYDHLAK